MLVGLLNINSILGLKEKQKFLFSRVDLPMHKQKYYATCSPSHGSDMKLLKNSYFENMLYAKIPA